MEDVVVHYKPGSAEGLSSLLETTQKLLEPFPCRTPPLFTAWFPSAKDFNLPIRPARPAPIITCSGDLLASERRPQAHTSGNTLRKRDDDSLSAERQHGRFAARKSIEDPRTLKDRVSMSETSKHLLPASVSNKTERANRLCPEKQTDQDGFTVTDTLRKRSWSVFKQRGVLLQSSQSMSKQFHLTVSKHNLHLRQRAKWVINQNNCAPSRDIEQVWQALSRCARSSPACNANIQRECAEIWVFCDVLQAEEVGRFLKDELELVGMICLSVHRLGIIFSL